MKTHNPSDSGTIIEKPNICKLKNLCAICSNKTCKQKDGIDFEVALETIDQSPKIGLYPLRSGDTHTFHFSTKDDYFDASGDSSDETYNTNNLGNCEMILYDETCKNHDVAKIMFVYIRDFYAASHS